MLGPSNCDGVAYFVAYFIVTGDGVTRFLGRTYCLGLVLLPQWIAYLGDCFHYSNFSSARHALRRSHF